MTTEEKLQELRNRWKTASQKERKLIEMRANLLKWGKETATEAIEKPKIEDLTTGQVTEIFK
jgi:hypothetical protein